MSKRVFSTVGLTVLLTVLLVAPSGSGLAQDVRPTASTVAATTSPTPAMTPMPPPPVLEVEPAGGSVSGGPVRVRVHAGGADSERLDLFAVLSGEREPRLLRSATVNGGQVAWEIRPDRNMELYARLRDGCCTANAGTSNSVRLDVRSAVTVAATRNGPRDYAFTGRVRPVTGQRVTLWRVEPDGRRVLAASSVVRGDGTYRIDRRFTGSGRFGFQVDAAGSEHAQAGRSSVRPTVVH